MVFHVISERVPMGNRKTALLSAIAGMGLVVAVIIPNLIVPTGQAKATERAAALPAPEGHARQVFQKTIAVTPSADASVRTGVFVVPAGKRLVIEYVAGAGPRLARDITLLTSVNGSQGQYPL